MKQMELLILILRSKLFTPYRNLPLDKNIENIESRNNISLILVIILFHEVFGHKKGGFISTFDNFRCSPNIFFNKKK